ncbi:MAG: response regulator transcription factor [Rubrivivax sp.]
MNTESFSKALLELYRLARTAPIQEFQRRAFDALSARLEFDTGWWGTASQVPGQAPITHATLPYRLPASYPQLWHDIRDEDTIAQAVLAAPGTTVNFTRKQLYASPGLASLVARFGITNCLCTVTLVPELNLMVFASLYRLEGKPPFNENERRYMQLLMPHLTSALTSNWMLHLERTRAARAAPGHGALAVVDVQGLLCVADPALSELMRREWPHWTGPLLPPSLVEHLRADAAFQGQRLSVRFHPLGELRLVDVRLLSPVMRLSPREREIAQRFSAGQSYKEIARDLGIAPATARHHLREIYRKLEVSDKATLARTLPQGSKEMPEPEDITQLQELPGASMSFTALPIE